MSDLVIILFCETCVSCIYMYVYVYWVIRYNFILWCAGVKQFKATGSIGNVKDFGLYSEGNEKPLKDFQTGRGVKVCLLKSLSRALAGVFQWNESWPANQRVTCLIPFQGTYLSCGLGHQ